MKQALAPAYKVIVGNVHKVGKTPFSTDPVFIGTFKECGDYIGHKRGLSIMRLPTATANLPSEQYNTEGSFRDFS